MWPVYLAAILVTVEGRAVNISNTWVLPEEGFPVFYRYFRDRISWYEADAVCQFHHANLVTVDTTAQYDAVRAYLKELDISSAVWVGLIRSNPEGDFTWTDYRGLSGDGYWSSAPDAHTAPLCAAADPAGDYRWEARACGGPTVASFICELPVPQWALGNEGCMVRALPALTVLYLPESAAVQLTADCGLAGVKRVQCTGNVKHEDLLKNLSCNEDDEITTIQNISSWSITTDTVFTEQDTTEYTTQENCVTEDQQLTPTSTVISSVTIDKIEVAQPKNKLNKVFLEKAFNQNTIHDNNLQSNDIPKLLNSESFLTNEESQKLKDEKSIQHKMLHEELARLGNYETVFSQPTDHFIPPLVMAKSRISDDMTVLSLEEKHAQQITAQKLSRHIFGNDNVYHPEIKNEFLITNHTLDRNTASNENNTATTFTPLKENENVKKDKAKLPKKYNEKLYDPKAKSLKAFELKNYKIEKQSTSTEVIPQSVLYTQDQIATEIIPLLGDNIRKHNVTNTKIPKFLNESEDDPSIDLTVIIKEPSAESEPKVFYSNNTSDITKLEKIKNETLFYVEPAVTHNPKIDSKNISLISNINNNNTTTVHEVIKISIINDKNTSNPFSFMLDVKTTAPVFKDDNVNITAFTPFEMNTDSINMTESTPLTSTASNSSVKHSARNNSENISATTNHFTNTVAYFITEEPRSKHESTLTTIILPTQIPTNTISYMNNTIENPLKVNSDVVMNDTLIDTQNINETEGFIDDIKNITSEVTDDFQSPLFSGANEPIHRPSRSRRLQAPKKIKFNPFRILG